MQYTGLLDCNNFFASCERLFRPDLVGKPVLVLSSNDGCVVARSQEVKDIGIPMGVPYFQIKDIIKDKQIQVFSSNFALYRDISKRVMAVVKREIEKVEVYSIDEAFVELEAKNADEALVRMQQLKTIIEQEIGIPVSVAVAGSKTQAKLVNRYSKKHGGAHAVEADTFLDQFGDEPVAAIWGIGGRLERRYKDASYQNVRDICVADTTRLQTLFGVHGVRLQTELRGLTSGSASTILSLPQSIMSTRSFAKKTNDLSFIKDALAYHVRSVSADLREQGLLATMVQVILETSRHGDYLLRGGRSECLLPQPTALTTDILKTSLELLEQLYEPAVPYNKVGVVLRGLCPEGVGVNGLFLDQQKIDNNHVVQGVMDKVAMRYGKDKLVVGKFNKESAVWQAKHETLSPAYTTRWTDIATVRAI